MIDFNIRSDSARCCMSCNANPTDVDIELRPLVRDDCNNIHLYLCRECVNFLNALTSKYIRNKGHYSVDKVMEIPDKESGVSQTSNNLQDSNSKSEYNISSDISSTASSYIELAVDMFMNNSIKEKNKMDKTNTTSNSVDSSTVNSSTLHIDFLKSKNNLNRPYAFKIDGEWKFIDSAINLKSAVLQLMESLGSFDNIAVKAVLAMNDGEDCIKMYNRLAPTYQVIEGAFRVDEHLYGDET